VDSCTSDAQTAVKIWLVQFKSSLFTTVFIGNSGVSTVETHDNSLLICGNTYSDSLLVYKISKYGDLIWRKAFLVNGSLQAAGVVETSEQEIFITCSSNLFGTHKDMTLAKLESNGDTIWTKKFVQPRSVRGVSIIETLDGNLIMAGNSESSADHLFPNISLVKVDTDGNSVWQKLLEFPGDQSARSIIELRNGDLLLTGSQALPAEPGTLLLVCLDSSGNIKWNRALGPFNKFGCSTVEVENGDLITCGYSRRQAISEFDLLIVRTDISGNVIWEKVIGDTTYSEMGRVLRLNSDGDLIVCGTRIRHAPSTGTDNMVLLFNPDGDLIWNNFTNVSEVNRCDNLVVDFDDVNIITGYSKSRIFMTRIDKNGNPD
jgi:hypothetical protein